MQEAYRREQSGSERAEDAVRGTVLVVDDAPDMLRWLTDTLEAQAYAVLVARSGEEALERLEYVVPDAVLLDLMMPVMNGWELVERLKGNARLRAVPVVVMTAASEPKLPDGVPLVKKPIDIDDMARRIAELCRAPTHS